MEKEINEEMLEEAEDSDSDLDLELDKKDVSYVLYGTRIKELIKDIGVSEGINISFSKDGFFAIQEYFRLISAVFAYEMVNLLASKGKKRITREIVQQSVNQLLSQSDAINISISELQKTIEMLLRNSKNSNIERATDYINGLQNSEGVKDE